MGLKKKEIVSIAQDTTAFYLYKDYVTSEDLIKIVDIIALNRPPFVLLPIVKTITEFNLGILTDEVKYEMLYKVGIASKRYVNLQQIVDMFHMYNISVSDDIIDRLIKDTLKSKDKEADKDCQIWNIIDCFNPKFTKRTIENILASQHFSIQTKMLAHILKQLIADKDFQFILETKILFDFVITNHPESAKQIVKKAIDNKQLDIIAKQSNNAYFPWEKGILFSDDLIEEMANLCLKEHRADLIFDIKRVFDYANKTNQTLAHQAVQQLFEDKKGQYISSSSRAMSYILKYEPELLKKLSLEETSMESVNADQTFTLLNEIALPNADLEFAYIKRNNGANAKFPPKEKLSPETQDYINIITDKDKRNPAVFKRLTPRVISALIECHFNNHADWYKVIEQLLIADPNMDAKYIKQMLNRDKKVEILIKRYWKAGSRKMRIKKFISEKKQAIMNAFGLNQKKR